MIKIPSYLKPGDVIGITCPAGYMEREKVLQCVATLQNWGYCVVMGSTVGGNSQTYFSGKDEERLADLQAMLDDDGINAVLCGRGGYGVGRIIDQIDFKKFRKKPKWVIGFSDITVFHAHVNRKLGIATLHAPMAAAFNDNGYRNKYVKSLKAALQGVKADYTCKGHRLNQPGEATAMLVGGNLALMVHTIGTPSEIETNGRILFIEDVGEQKYNIDRMMYQLKRSGKLAKLRGLILGGFTDVLDTTRPFGEEVHDILRHLVEEYDYPICYNFPVSHDKENYALKVGCTYHLFVSAKQVRLRED
ncbi:MAG: LD-carboxypeptidase [Niabella sp.]